LIGHNLIGVLLANIPFLPHLHSVIFANSLRKIGYFRRSALRKLHFFAQRSWLAMRGDGF
jgi:hypothetical protein